ncbi:tRNA 5-methoxyuridine(34)/uridine 5-oxyacetic acid(34) synthase CmoB [Helicobacter sp. 11S02629-2]|uniref:tRNA 5-methoxyuridine(34)/uridine 5-oxyacetic acid(34) synthase CmoB n=1 Tax=Helicobacter sp. 11S02629-2 TaxID=1476195 RepID=UPI000BA5BAFE|nr:tRNA 5-methoxyuridine(34)/uridine 5-oxyacetic acid(34) synthase CmoB [Helicobacter sp. 11S02629-2]PAF43107.1 hypothetical protein BKH40_07265 [Helicobacter sp. 11S02629-2]
MKELYEKELKLLSAKDILALEARLQNLQLPKALKVESKKGLHLKLDTPLTQEVKDYILALKPWRKGPFYLEEYFIDSEWQSFIKLKALLKTLASLGIDLKQSDIIDIGANNAYYAFELALKGAQSITCLDPSGRFYKQFEFINKLANFTNINYRLLGIEDAYLLKKSFDLVLCLGVLYHRKDPLNTLKELHSLTKKDGTLILETLIINQKAPLSYTPYPSYAGMKNVYFLHSPSALSNLSLHAGFKSCDLVHKSYTTSKEQRSTEFIDSKSLGDSIESIRPKVLRAIFALKR